jgi:hypothetical protein
MSVSSPSHVKVRIVNRGLSQQCLYQTVESGNRPAASVVEPRLNDPDSTIRPLYQASVTWNDCRLDITVAVQHVAEDLLQPR